MYFTYLSCIDTKAGRFDKASIPQQALMELLIEKFNSRSQLFTEQDAIPDFCTWVGITCSEEGELTKISWSIWQQISGGTLCLQWLPLTVQTVCIENSQLCGKIETHKLPESLEHLSLLGNCINGSFDCGGLPRKLQTLNLFSNRLSGEVDFKSLPPSLLHFTVKGNDFHGTFDLDVMPRSMTIVNIAKNQFCGEISLRGLPEGIRDLFLEMNSFCGTLDLTKFPQSLRRANLALNSFQGTVSLQHLPGNLSFLSLVGNRLCGTVQVRRVNGRMIDLSQNEVTVIWDTEGNA